jgi:hypothetical protein
MRESERERGVSACVCVCVCTCVCALTQTVREVKRDGDGKREEKKKWVKKCANTTINYQRFFPLCQSYMECLPLCSLVCTSFLVMVSVFHAFYCSAQPLLCFEGGIFKMSFFHNIFTQFVYFLEAIL